MDEIRIKAIKKKKRSLKRYKRNKECIYRLIDKLDRLNENMTSVKSPTLSDMPRGGTPVTNEDLIADKLEVEERIHRLTIKGQNYRRNILEEIDTLEDPRYAEVLEEFCIECKSFDEIADSMGYNTKSIIRLYAQAIEELVSMEDY